VLQEYKFSGINQTYKLFEQYSSKRAGSHMNLVVRDRVKVRSHYKIKDDDPF
jgi:hypothetical protein